jgi:hypothetical protein
MPPSVLSQQQEHRLFLLIPLSGTDEQQLI